MTGSDVKITSEDLHAIQNTDLNIAPGVELTELQKKHAGVVLDLFQAKGTMTKLEDNFTEDAVYEDLFAKCKDRKEVAGQLLGLPLVTKKCETLSHEVTSCRRTTATRGNGAQIEADEIDIKVHHRFTFKLGGKEFDMHSTLVIFSSEAEGKIVRFQDRPMDNIPDNGLLSAMRKFNAVAAPSFVGIPKDEKEDAKKMAKHQT